MENSNIKYDILSIQERANKNKELGHNVINGCAGMLFDDSKNLVKYDEIVNSLLNYTSEYLYYPSVQGTDSFKEGSLNWIFKENYNFVKGNFNVVFCTTLGGTGACSMLFNQFENKTILFSDICWPNYFGIAETNHAKYKLFNMFNSEDSFDFTSLTNTIDECLLTNDKLLLVVNDPCHNPTGYCMSKNEYLKLFELLNKYQNKVELLLDIAYLDYSTVGFIFKDLIKEINFDFNIHIAFSCSKSFGIYGVRLGGLVSIFNKSFTKSTEILNAYKAYARSTYSCPNNSSMGPISKFFDDENAKKSIIAKIEDQKNRLDTISKKLIQLLDEFNFYHVPYKAGFFLIFKVDDSISLCKILEENYIYFAPINKNYIRIAISSLSLNDIEILKERFNNIWKK